MALWEVVCDTVQSAWKLLTGYSLEEWLHAVGALVLVVLCAFLLAILPLAEWIQAVCSFFLVVLGGILLAVFLLILVYCKPAWLKRVEDFLVTKLKRIATLKTKVKRTTGPGFLAEHETLLKQTQDRLRDLEERMDKQESQKTVIGRAEQHTHSRLRVLEERMAKQESQNKEQLMETESQLAKLLWLEIIYVHGAKPLPVGIDTIFKCRYQGDPQTITFAYMNGRQGCQLILKCVQNDDGAMRRSVSFDQRDYHGQWSVGWVERTVLVKQTWNIVIEESRQTLERPCLVLRVDFNAKPTCPVKQHIFGFDACGSNWVLLQTRLCAQTTMKQTTARI
jgi:hypothetical protein